MSGFREDGIFELTPTKARFYLRRKDIPKEFEGLDFFELIIKIFEWQGINARVGLNKGHPSYFIVEATQRQIWEALSGQPGVNKSYYAKYKP